MKFNLKWWFCRLVLFRWVTGCGGDGFKKNPETGMLEVCYKWGCH